MLLLDIRRWAYVIKINYPVQDNYDCLMGFRLK